MISGGAVVRSRRRFVLAAFAFLTVGTAPAAMSQPACGSPMSASRVWSAPLDRIVALQARNVTLRDGLDRLAAAARFRLSYSAELLPLDRRVCVSSDSVVAGQALLQLLSGTGVEAVATAADQVVLTLSRGDATVTQEPLPETQMLDRVVVTGSATGNAQRPLTVALDVLDGKKLAERGSNSFSAGLDGSVPGLWLWEQSPSSLLARYGSIRGASSFGVSYPKVYIDGIEVANPLLLTELNPAVLDHVEVIRGPQGAALYGADAISGVVNIVTRHEGTQAGAERTDIVTAAGLSETSYASRSVLAQNHALTMRGGSSTRSGSASINVTTLGGYVPQAYSRDLKLNGAFRAVTSSVAVTGTGRFYGKQAAIGENPLLRGFPSATASRGSLRSLRAAPEVAQAVVAAADSLPESIHQYTIGGTATVFTSGRWTPNFVAGLDGYRLANVPNDLAMISSAIDTALHNARGGADRATFRAGLVGQFGRADSAALTVTLGAEHSVLRETQEGIDQLTTSGARLTPMLIDWRTNSGLIAQSNVAIRDAFYLTGGLRLERNDGFTVAARTDLLPMLGAAVVRDVGIATLKVRSAYGRGIRPVQTPVRLMSWRDMHRSATGPDLEPEEQSGTELGADLLVGRVFAAHVTRFDQRAFGLIQPVAIPHDSQPSGSGGPGPSDSKPHIEYVLQNVGEISNRGWELESSVNFGPITLGGALSVVDSRVRRIARRYTGDLLPGDRMLAVPANTVGLSASLNRPGWVATVSASRASDWINYDRLRLAKDFSSATSSDSLTGRRLRSYWMSYDGVTRLRATLSRNLLSNIALTLTGDNLTNVQRGEPDNITLLPGRTVLVGLNAKIR
jgi:iron complex outermembrane recepter protein